MLDCNNITSLRRTLSGGAKLLMGDQVLSGCAIKVSNSFTKAPVTEDNPKGKRKSRKKSFCARMRGMRKRQKKKNNTGKDRLSLSLKKWKCRDGGPCGPNAYKSGGFLEKPTPILFED